MEKHRLTLFKHWQKTTQIDLLNTVCRVRRTTTNGFQIVVVLLEEEENVFSLLFSWRIAKWGSVY